MPLTSRTLLALPLFCVLIASPALCESVNEPLNSAGRTPQKDGRTLNLNFEKGDLSDWTAAGPAWGQQPVKGEIDQRRIYGEGRRSLHTGEYWLGGFERLHDAPIGTLTSVAFPVDAPWASFLVGGGNHPETRVEIVQADDNQVLFSASGINQEEMRPVVINLESVQGKNILIRIVDEATGSWGHVNFDDFRFHDTKPEFKQGLLTPRSLIASGELYPYENLNGEEAARVMRVPAGFKVQLGAQEPDVKQPVAMAIDDRGRVWVAEAYAYPTRQEQGAGKDRILIFEDTDLDGTLDKRTVFVEGLNLVSGFEVGFDGVYVGAAPYLMFIPDRNQNDIPDGLEDPAVAQAASRQNLQYPKDVPPGAEVLLDGFAWQDTHETLNAFIWGPDGWLYGCHGVFTHSLVGTPGMADADRQPLNAGIWRYHPTKKLFEVFCHGTSNPWGVDFNQYGDAFATACVIPHLFQMIPGARYQRQGGQHFNPFTYDDIKTIARHRHFVGYQWSNEDRRASDDAGGGHAHAGAMIYQGGAWPEEYENKLFMHNIHGNRINVDVLIPEGSGYAGDRNPDFLFTGDKWSQMINLQYGPDGQVWMIDWYDQNQCHHWDDKIHDRGNGRIYRVSYGDAAPVKVDLAKASTEELIDHALNAKNEWYARHARRLLQERHHAGEWTEAEFAAKDPADPRSMLRAMWLAQCIGAKAFPSAFTHKSPQVRSWAVRWDVEYERLNQPNFSQELLERLASMAQSDPSPVVRLSIASAVQHLPNEDRWGIMEGLVSHAEDVNDQNLPFMYWYAMEPLADSDPQRALLLGMAAGEKIPVLREFMIRRLGSGKTEDALALLVRGLGDSTDEAARLTFLRGIRGSLVGTKGINPPNAWHAIYSALVKPESTSRDFDVYLHALGLGARFGDSQAAEKLRRLTLDESAPPAERKEAFSFLVENRDSDLAGVVAKLLQGASLRRDAIRAVATLDDPKLAYAILDSYASLAPAERTDARNALASRAAYASPLLQAVRDNRIAKSDLSADLVRQMRNLDDKNVNDLLENVWGVVRASDRDRQALIHHYTRIIRDPNGPHADPELGRALFVKTCEQCHTLFGTGGKVGPDITGSNRANLDYILSNILDPSSVMAKEYQPTVLATADGRVLTGIIKDESDNAVVLQTTNEMISIAKSDIEARKGSDTSMMPDDLIRNLTREEVRSLIAYLASPGQTAIAATPDTKGRFFNGTDLTGWRATREVDAPLWTVENGEIVGKSPGIKHNSFLVNELSLGDFKFSCDVLLVDNVGNSGIQFRSEPLSDGEVKGYQADIGAGWWGKLYEERGRGLIVDNDAEKLARPGEWNHYEIQAIGSRIRTFINGQPAVDLNDPAGARRGSIALQLHAGGPMEVRFKNLKVELVDVIPPYAAAGSAPAAWPVSAGGKATGKITWEKARLDDLFRSEGVCAGDFDNDGDLDVASGSVWYEQIVSADGTTWKQHLIGEEAKEFDPMKYSDTFINYAEDVNGDGWVDVIVLGFPAQATHWFENPGNPAEAKEPWKRHEMIPVTNNESPQYLDITRDGKRELLTGVGGNLVAYSMPQADPEAPWKSKTISLTGQPGGQMFSHGLGAGDINGDGRIDVVTVGGWWECPEHLAVTDWTFHPANLGDLCSHMYVHDFDGDGDADVLSCSAHKVGMWWHEQLPPEEGSKSPSWKTHLIDESFTQTHAVILADINGDGLPDFVTGKRWWAHAPPPPGSPFPGDPGVNDPAVIAWFEYSLEDGKPVWTKHQIDDNSGVGTQFEVADMNGDGLLDIIVSNKKGTFVLTQVRADE